MRVHKMTKWDAGQDLIACSDYLGEKQKELRENGFIELADIVQSARLKIGTAFNKLGSHVFDLPSDSDKEISRIEGEK